MELEFALLCRFCEYKRTIWICRSIKRLWISMNYWVVFQRKISFFSLYTLSSSLYFSPSPAFAVDLIDSDSLEWFIDLFQESEGLSLVHMKIQCYFILSYLILYLFCVKRCLKGFPPGINKVFLFCSKMSKLCEISWNRMKPLNWYRISFKWNVHHKLELKLHKCNIRYSFCICL